MLNSCLAYSSTMQMEPIYSSETSSDFQWATRNYMPEERILWILKSVCGYGLDLSGLTWGLVLDACEHG
jgi:hypothetical protein